jgi:hypothetical protein
MKFRKKPVVIDAVQLRLNNWLEMCEHAIVGAPHSGKPYKCCVGADGIALPDGVPSAEIGLLIPTLEGLMLARQNDWVIRGVNGELYPCKPDIFEKTYEPIPNATL